ncbi:unnamed protein product [Arctia plantaginis]|uniref:Reverse transcriptase Ty1/copia-type domain-containing protein n=1 Tax=Arctia plantaginis TaxID=874455 RepID=A0A8S0Z708_ARCPL|nr:unnamed protein product [Arctia plantaginis]
MISRPKLRLEGSDPKTSNDKTDITELGSKSVSEEGQYFDRSKSDSLKSDQSLNNPTEIQMSEPAQSDRETECKHIPPIVNNEHTEHTLRRSNRVKGRPPVSYKEIDDDCLVYAQSIICQVPNCYNKIKTREDKSQWEQAIKDKLNSLLINNTWTLVPRPINKNIIDCKWVFSIKHNEFGEPLKYKARLVARGFSQKYLIDYNETFAPFARISSFRFIIGYANQYNLLVHHMDVKTAFLNDLLKEQIYMNVSEGVYSKNNYVCKLNRVLYGLKQAA